MAAQPFDLLYAHLDVLLLTDHPLDGNRKPQLLPGSGPQATKDYGWPITIDPPLGAEVGLKAYCR